MLKERKLAWQQFAITLAVLILFFLFPSWLPENLNRTLGITVQAVVYVAGAIALFRVWRR